MHPVALLPSQQVLVLWFTDFCEPFVRFLTKVCLQISVKQGYQISVKASHCQTSDEPLCNFSEFLCSCDLLFIRFLVKSIVLIFVIFRLLLLWSCQNSTRLDFCHQCIGFRGLHRFVSKCSVHTWYTPKYTPFL